MTSITVKKKLQSLAAAEKFDLTEVRFVLRHWEDASGRLQSKVISSVKTMDRIPPKVQCAMIRVSDRATKALGGHVCPEAQDLILSEFKQDIPTLVANCTKISVIGDSLWKHLTSVVSNTRKLKNPTLTKKAVSSLVRREDCPVAFAKAAGLTKSQFERERRKGNIKPMLVRQTVKTDNRDTDSFMNIRRVARAVRSANRSIYRKHTHT